MERISLFLVAFFSLLSIPGHLFRSGSIFGKWKSVNSSAGPRTKYTIDEIAKEFGVTRTAVIQWIKKGLPFVTEKRIGFKRRRLIDKKDVFVFHGLSYKE